MNILKELKKAWDNAFTTRQEKNAGGQGLEELKKEIEEAGLNALPDKAELPDLPEYEFMEKDKTSDTELADKASSALKGYENQTLKGIEESVKTAAEKLERDKKTAAESKEKTINEIQGSYDRARAETENDALKRGLARSSIAINRVADVESGRAKAVTDTEAGYAAALQQLDGEINGLAVKRQEAINDFNITLAVKLQEKIDELKKQRDDTNKEALKYNNSLEEKRAKEEADKLKTESDLYSQALTQKQKENELKNSGAVSDSAYRSNYEKMDALLSSMNRSDAAKLLKEDTFFRDNLSDYLYYKLYSAYAR